MQHPRIFGRGHIGWGRTNIAPYLTGGSRPNFIHYINRLLAVQVQVHSDDIHEGLLLLLLISPCPILYIYLRGATCGSVRYKQVYILTKLRFKPLPPPRFLLLPDQAVFSSTLFSVAASLLVAD
jgi:hypothetical protein